MYGKIVIAVACLMLASSFAGCVGKNETALVVPDERVELSSLAASDALLHYTGEFHNGWAVFRLDIPESWWMERPEDSGFSLPLLLSLDYTEKNRPLASEMEQPPEGHFSAATIMGETQSGLQTLGGVMTQWYARIDNLLDIKSTLALERIYLLLVDCSVSAEGVVLKVMPVDEAACTGHNTTIGEIANMAAEVEKGRISIEMLPDATGTGADFAFYKRFVSADGKAIEYMRNVEAACHANGMSEIDMQMEEWMQLSCSFANLSKTTWAHTELWVDAYSSMFSGMMDSSYYTYSTCRGTYDSYDDAQTSIFGLGFDGDLVTCFAADTAQQNGSISFDYDLTLYGGEIGNVRFASFYVAVDFEAIYDLGCKDLVAANDPARFFSS